MYLLGIELLLSELNKPLQGMALTEYLPSACLHAFLLSYLPASCLPAWLLACLLAYLFACLLACLLTCLLACLLAYPRTPRTL